MKDALKALSSLPSLTKPAGRKKAVVEDACRIKDAPAAFAVFDRMRRDDEGSNMKRALVQAMFDGAPPHNQSDLNETGQGDRSNLNFDEGGAMLEYSMSGYVDLFTSTEHFIRVKLKHGSFPEDEQLRYEDLMTAEFSNMLRQWNSYFSRYLYTCHHFVANGLSVNYHADPVDWRWEAAKFGDFFIPRMTKADPGALNVAGVAKNYTASELYRYISNEDAAKLMGWDVKEVKNLLMERAKSGKQDLKVDMNSWEDLQEVFKNNDLQIDTIPDCSNIRLAILWVREHSLKWSQYIFEDSGTVKKFLFAKRERYAAGRTPFTIYPYGIGSNGYYHSVRGLGYKIYPHVQISNRMLNTTVDAAMLGSSLLIQPVDEQALNDLALTYYGPFAVLPPGNKVVERPTPDLQKSAMPVIREMTSRLQGKTGGYSSVGIFADEKERSRFEVEAYVARASKLSITALNLFYEPWQSHLREVLRRVFAPNYGQNMPGGTYVWDLRERLRQSRVPVEAFEKIDFDRCSVVRAVGGGSAEARQMILDKLAQEAPALDDIGRLNLRRDRVAALVGFDSVDRYVAPNTQSRTTVDDKMAILENAALAAGTPVEALSNEAHIPHLQRHTAWLSEKADQIDSGAVQLIDVVESMFRVHEHGTKHVILGGSDPAIAQAISGYRQQLQRFGEFIHNGQEQLQKLQREQAEQGAATPAQPAGLTPEMEQKLMEHNLRLRMEEEKHQLKLQLQMAEANQKRMLADAEARARTARLGVLP